MAAIEIGNSMYLGPDLQKLILRFQAIGGIYKSPFLIILHLEFISKRKFSMRYMFYEEFLSHGKMIMGSLEAKLGMLEPVLPYKVSDPVVRFNYEQASSTSLARVHLTGNHAFRPGAHCQKKNASLNSQHIRNQLILLKKGGQTIIQENLSKINYVFVKIPTHHFSCGFYFYLVNIVNGLVAVLLLRGTDTG